ncbi:MAG: hypothetical protein Q8P63_02860 [Candidatus Nealsonbacteria bacterium]|nr:hypothetical protein [Candidatus Nealsonbacteria bacterium]
MSTFKDFQIWVGWMSYKHAVVLCSIFLVVCGTFILSLMFSIISRPGYWTINALFSFFILVLFFLGWQSISSESNHKIAIEKAISFKSRYPKSSPRIDSFIIATQSIKDGKYLTKWMDYYSQLVSLTEKLEKSEAELETLPIKIKDIKEEIKIFHMALFDEVPD